MKKWFYRIYYAFPIQLLLLHLRSNLSLFVLWILLFATVGGYSGRSMGFHYLFLDPEYLGEVSFWSFFWVGLSFGLFYIAWNTTTYILHSYRFPFLASFNRPFAKFSFNNFLLPLAFILFYLRNLVNFQWFNEFAAQHNILYYCFGFLCGFSSTIVASILYFQYTNRDILSLRAGQLKLSKAIQSLAIRKRDRVWELHQDDDPYRYAWRVDYFFTEGFKLRPVRNVKHYNFKHLERIFRQNHANALIIQSLSIVALILMGALVEYEFCRIPSASSMLLLCSVFTTVLGAISYWMQEWRNFFIVALIVGLNYLVSIGWLYHENRAFGLDYHPEPVAYTYEHLDSLASTERYEADRRGTVRILQNWQRKFVRTLGLRKPKLILICSSGGGSRAALWTMQVLRELDQSTEGRFMEHSVLMTGASGGMLGAAYYRELCLQKKGGKDIDLYDSRYMENVGKDLANALTFTLTVNDLFIPWVDRRINGYLYKQDRGYVFEQQFIENTEGLMGKSLGDYKKPEEEALIPMMLVSPIIMNDGRFLLISPQRMSYLMRPPATRLQAHEELEIDGVDFLSMFREHNAANLRFATALRMSATYPLIFPAVHLPTSPGMEVMDAGFRDNYGIETAVRFCAVHRDWIKTYTSGVLLVSIRGSEKFAPIPKNSKRTLFSNIFTPLSSVLDVDMMQDFHHDNHIAALKNLFGPDKVELFHFVYRPTRLEERASLSLHLTRREKNDIVNAIYLDQNQTNIKRIKQLLR